MAEVVEEANDEKHENLICMVGDALLHRDILVMDPVWVSATKNII